MGFTWAGVRHLRSIVAASLPCTRGIAAWKPVTNETMHARTTERIITAGETADALASRHAVALARCGTADRPTVGA